MLHRLLLACCLTLTACGAADTTTTVSGLQYLGQMRVWPGATLDGTVIGGLSGISYDPVSQLYFVISDDRSAKNPARFYTARISLSPTALTTSSSSRPIRGSTRTASPSGRWTSTLRHR